MTRRILEKEVENLRKAKEATSATVISNREKKKQGVFVLLKTVVKLADKSKLSCLFSLLVFVDY